MLNPEKINSNTIIITAYYELIKYIPGLIIPFGTNELINIEFVSIFPFCISDLITVGAG